MTELYSSRAEPLYTFVDGHGNDVTAEVYAEAARIEMERHEKALEARARRAARAAGYVAKKSRWRVGSVDNYGHFMIVDPSTNFVVNGFRFDMIAEEVIEYFAS